jgi:hypothetical protein
LRWKILSPFEKGLYVLGFCRGYQQGIFDAGSIALTNQLQPPTLTPEQKKDALDMAAKAKKHGNMLTSAVSMGQITDAMSVFYGDFRNLPVCWDDAVLFSVAALGGQSPTDEDVAASRKAGAESGCK